MLNFPRWKVWGISLICLIVSLMAVPSFLPASAFNQLPPFARGSHINLGLDLAGGSQLLLEAETQDVARTRGESMEETMRREFRTASPAIRAQFATSNGEVRMTLDDPARLNDAANAARRQIGQVGNFRGADWAVSTADGRQVIMRQTDAGVNEGIRQAMEVARDVIDRRINALGTLEPTIIQQGANRILVQVPGMQDPEALKRLIGRTARLEFKLVETDAVPCNTPRRPGIQFLPTEEQPGQCLGVQSRAMVSGEQIVDARQDYNENNEVSVRVSFNVPGSQRFAQVTQANVRRRFAIILDNRIISAPTINEPILGGTASISGSFTVESANALAISLRSGRLPVELRVVDERSVSAELGAESIRSGLIASIASVLVVIMFMLVTYGRFGVYTTIGLILNGLMIFGIMGLFNATLTLPGIAGFVLTIGAAVDANVLINERIREEQRRGRRLHDALESGYREASTAIFDANVTNVIAAVLMFYFGSGPIRGFAVVLMIGIVTSVFTAVNVTRMFVALWVRKARPKELHI
ncbi:MAG TPA: protein translocase subunit SecD [Allosphingosinicella sp.]|nr:protein translocase subunit SecD [Allosphingosinicella sp.]